MVQQGQSNNIELKVLSSDILHECKSRSGLCPLDPTGGDGSMFDIIVLTSCHKNWNLYIDLNRQIVNNQLSPKKANQIYREEFINTFMILHHNIISKYKKFNWNDDD